MNRCDYTYTKNFSRLWDGKPIKLDCDDNCTTINVIH